LLSKVRSHVNVYRRSRAGITGVRGSGKEEGGGRNKLKGVEVVAEEEQQEPF
jgi:hypothetical protein